MSRTAISGSPDLVSGRTTSGGSKVENEKAQVSTITSNINLKSSSFLTSSQEKSKRYQKY